MQYRDQASAASIQEAIALHIEPDINWQSLPRLLDIIAHITLLAVKLNSEIDRIRRDAVHGAGVKIEMEHETSLTGICTMCKTAEEILWEQSIKVRELVRSSYIPRVDLVADSVLIGCDRGVVIWRGRSKETAQDDWHLLPNGR